MSIIKHICLEDETPSGIGNRNVENLNLYNFDNNLVIDYPYILTSPRSLKACSLANVKPIELLHRSITEIAKDLNLSETKVNHIYTDYEHERLRKLEVCKLIRKHIITSEFRYSQDSLSKSSEDVLLGRDDTIKSSFTRDNRRNTQDLFYSLKRSQSYSPCSSPATPIVQYNSLRQQRNKIPNYGLSNYTSLSSLNTDICNDTCKQRSNSAECKQYKKNNLKKTLKRNLPNVRRPLNKKKKEPNKGNPVLVNQINNQQLCWQIDKVKNTENNYSNKKLRPNQKTKKEIPEVKKVLKEKQNMREQNNNVKSCQKILLSKKHESEKKQKFIKYDLKSVTAAEKQEHTKHLNDKYNESIKNMKTETNQNSSKTKTELTTENWDSIKSHDARILDAMVLKKETQRSKDNLARKANQIWEMNENEVIGKNECHVKRNSKIKKMECCTCEDNLNFDQYFQQIRDRIKQLKKNSLHKELHSEHVRQLARELQIGMEQWQDQVLLLQWQALQRARTNAKLHLENRRLKTQSENNERALLHALRFRNIQDMERIKQQIIKKEIKEKDYRIERLKMKREREILDCRAQAYYTAELRDQLRRTLTPDTFDRKVNDALIKSKFVNRSLTASPFTESHIRLG